MSEPSWSLHPPPYTPGVGSPAVFRPFCARIPLGSTYPSRTRTYEQYHFRCDLYSHFIACYSPSLPLHWVIASSGTIAAKTSSMTSRGTHSGIFTVPGITSLCTFVLNTVDRHWPVILKSICFSKYVNRGDVVWLNRSDAFTQRLAYVNDRNQVVMRVDNTTNVPYNEKRNSVRIESRDWYGVGSLWIIDIAHVPYGCSVSLPCPAQGSRR